MEENNEFVDGICSEVSEETLRIQKLQITM